MQAWVIMVQSRILAEEKGGGRRGEIAFEIFYYLKNLLKMRGGINMGADLTWCIIYTQAIPILGALLLIYYFKTRRG